MSQLKTGVVTATFAFLLLISKGQPAGTDTGQYRDDFNYFWSTINDEYSYFNKKQIAWEKVKQHYLPLTDTVSSRNSFIGIMEKAINELYDHHCYLNTNTPLSGRLVPTSADVWAEYINGKPVVTEVRMHSGAEEAGIAAGMEITAINGKPVEEAVNAVLPVSLQKNDTEARAFCLRILLAGNHVDARKFNLKSNGVTAEFLPDKNGMKLEEPRYTGMIETKLYNTIGYIRINNCLYDNALIAAFDSVMQLMKNTKGLILDLRETPSGGNTSVARAILGWFISKDHFYQKHEYYAEEKMSGIKRSWEEIVSPRTGKYYSKPLAVLVDHWTGSIAEAIAIGFDSFKRPATNIIGTEMARLNGAVYSYEMPKTKIGFSFTAERLFHINGTPRENYIPGKLIPLQKRISSKTGDVFIATALELLNRK